MHWLSRRVCCSNRVLVCVFLCSLLYFLVNSGIITVALLWRDTGDLEGFVEEGVLEHEKLSIHRQIKWIDDKNIDTTPDTCRNTIQGPTIITDDNGDMCPVENVLATGCCDSQALTYPRFTCTDCLNATSCCTTFEGCVSCCLDPGQRSHLENVIRGLTGKRLRAFRSVRDQFQLCMLKCRTSSHSVQNENKYKNSRYKYCYGLEPKLAYDEKRRRK